MAGRGGTTFEKRRKEQLRKEKREQKIERKLQRKKESSVDNPANGDLNPGAGPVEIQTRSIENAGNARASSGGPEMESTGR